ncbi:hypothetical protein THAOC_14829 [Thalassiosira oceanica]|uniref:Uncharacterized protein n=1 Tax=Thalassiosira oceanica TaxID=159749 RepID=K0SHH2_THAOC|nr:hypothetical protein THAOC_14829 [Thalassiosira oceanica]|eukprot:EJK64434.1 hypothetical protein THAOC_14829 [Thalassiosira oceanica]
MMPKTKTRTANAPFSGPSPRRAFQPVTKASVTLSSVKVGGPSWYHGIMVHDDADGTNNALLDRCREAGSEYDKRRNYVSVQELRRSQHLYTMKGSAFCLPLAACSLCSLCPRGQGKPGRNEEPTLFLINNDPSEETALISQDVVDHFRDEGIEAIPMALRPPLSIKRAGSTANLCIIARAWPTEVSEPLITSFLWKPAAITEVRCGIELSPCSAACPSGTIHTSFSFWPAISVLGSSAAPRRHLGGTSVGWPTVRVRICRSDDAAAGCRGELVYKSTFDVANRRSMEARG